MSESLQKEKRNKVKRSLSLDVFNRTLTSGVASLFVVNQLGGSPREYFMAAALGAGTGAVSYFRNRTKPYNNTAAQAQKQFVKEFAAGAVVAMAAHVGTFYLENSPNTQDRFEAFNQWAAQEYDQVKQRAVDYTDPVKEVLFPEVSSLN